MKQSKSNFTEEKFVSWLKKLKPDAADSSVITGIGDDAAVVSACDGFLVLTTDAIVEDVHFRAKWSSAEDIGWKAMAVNVSDMAAMGVQPAWALVTAGIPQNATVQYIKSVHKGLSLCAQFYGCRLVGGDTVRSGKWFINVTVAGTTKKNPILRSGAKEGDFIFITGALGSAACALEILQSNTISKKYCAFKKYHTYPHARLYEGLALAKTQCVTSMMDISDGLSKDLLRLCEASGVGARIFKNLIPIRDEILRLCGKLRRNPYDLALHGGEDYELLFTVPGEKVKQFFKAFSRLASKAEQPVLIGEIIRDKKCSVFLVENEKSAPMTSGGYDHFSSLKN